MKLRHKTTIIARSPSIAKVTALAWSPNGRKLAVVTISGVVSLYDEKGTLKEKFPTKPADPKGSKLYIVIGMAFSPDSTKLAIVQSDDIIFIYRLGLDWGEKKSICNKFQQTLPINNIIWPHSMKNEVVFGLSDGKVKVGHLRTNRTTTTYTHGANSPVTSLACSLDGCSCVVGHLDGSVYRFSLDKGSEGFVAKLTELASVPIALSWGKSIVIAGSDCRVSFRDINGMCQQTFEYHSGKGFSSISINATGDTVVVGCYNGLHFFHRKSGINNVWVDGGLYEVKNLYTVSAVSWKPDGSQIVVGSLCGEVELYDAYLKTEMYNDKFEFSYISENQVLLTQLVTHTKMLLQSERGLEILKINIYMEQYLIAQTEETLLLGDLENCKLSEILWQGSGYEKFLLDTPSICLIYDRGELSIIEYGCNDILTTIQTDHVQEALISIRFSKTFPSFPRTNHGNNRIAYLVDLQTLQVNDLFSGDSVKTVVHDCEIIWLQLNPQASHLLFCDKRRQLYLLGLNYKGHVIMLLRVCNFVQWVPDTDVVIAQSQATLYIWYSIEDIQHATKFHLKGDVEAVQHVQGHIEILAYEGDSVVAYELDETLIGIGLALENMELDYVQYALTAIEPKVETKLLWKQLSEKSLHQMNFFRAEEAYACIGEICYSRYLHKINKKLRNPLMEDADEAGKGLLLMQVTLAMLSKKWKDAERILLDHGRVEDAIKMDAGFFRWKDAISISRADEFHDTKALCTRHLNWLMETGQIEEACKEKISVGDVGEALKLYLNGNLFGHAADHISKVPAHLIEGPFLTKITESLTNLGMFEKLGELMENVGDWKEAMSVYEKGHCYHHAVKLAWNHFNNDVVRLKESWGDWLVSKHQLDTAIDHYLEAGCISKALESAMSSHQWTKAIQIVAQEKNKVAGSIYLSLAQHFQKIKQLPVAESLFLAGKQPIEAVKMYLKEKEFEEAQKIAAQLLSADETRAVYVHEAENLESSRCLQLAEKLYLEAEEYDLAINMYKRKGMFDNVIQLVSNFKKELMKETHIELAQELERKGMLRDAEHHYLEAYDWKSVVKMYSISNMWEDALRVVRLWGDITAIKQVVYAWAISRGGNEGTTSLSKMGLLDQAIEYAVDVGAFNNAFHLCSTTSSEKLEEVHLAFAKFLEDKGRFKEAEDNLLKARKPREAIDMYIRHGDWESASRVADLFSPSAVTDIQVSQAEFHCNNNDFKKAESLFIQAKKPDLAIDMYKAKNMWEDAIRVAHNFLPSQLSELQYNYADFVHSNNDVPTLESILIRGKMAESKFNFEEAMDLYLQIDLKLLPDMEKLKKVWQKAVCLAKTYARERVPEVIHTVSEQLVRAGQYQDAAKVYLDFDNLKEAINIYIRGGYWDEARKLAQSLGHEEFFQDVEDGYNEQLSKTNDLEHDANMDTQESLQRLSQKENYEKVYKAASAISRCGLPHTSKSTKICECITSQLVYFANDSPTSIGVLQNWRTFLYNHIQNIEVSTNQSAYHELETLLVPLTYVIRGFFCNQKGLKELAAKLSVSLLRFIKNIPADKAFFEAGMLCKEVGWNGKAFVYLNQYLDVAEAIDDGDSNIMVDDPMLSNSDIPSCLAIPRNHFVKEEKREEVQDWVIQFSVEQKNSEKSSSLTRECEVCKQCLYEACLFCFTCKTESKACCVTGYPVKAGGYACESCQMPANESDWVTYVEAFHACPWCCAPAEARKS